MSDGHAYVRVEAEASDGISLYAAGSNGGGAITMGATINWTRDGGIEGDYGWVKPSGRKLVPFPMDTTLPAEEISAQLAAAWDGCRGGHLNQIDWCVEYNMN